MSTSLTTLNPLNSSRPRWIAYFTKNLTAANKIILQVSHELELRRINLYLSKLHALQAEDEDAQMLELYDVDVKAGRRQPDIGFRARLMRDAEETRFAYQMQREGLARWARDSVKDLAGLKEAREKVQGRLAEATAEVESWQV